MLATMLLGVVPPAAWGQTSETEELRRAVEALQRSDRQKQQRIEALEQEIEKLRGGAEKARTRDDKSAALERAVAEASAPEKPAAPAGWSRPVGGSSIRLIDIALDIMAAAGTSTATDEEISGLQAGGHDPSRRGFTLQQAELSLTGAVDPYLSAEAHIVYLPGGVELEEAFLTTQSLPYGLQLEAGHSFSEFGRINPSHPHAWDWLDQPVINSRLFGADGLRAPGVRLGWLTPLPWFSEIHLGAQNANEGETTASFIGPQGIGGRPTVHGDVRNLGDLLYLARWNQAWDLNGDTALLFGMSGLHGPNGTGANGETWIYGGDLKLRWRPETNFRGWPFFLWQSEVGKRDYTAAAVNAIPAETNASTLTNLPGAVLRDRGFYTQALYGFRYGWAAGLRYEHAGGSGESAGGRDFDPLRDDRQRLSPLLVWHPTEYSRFRLQYNFDHADHLSGDAHSAWMGAEVMYGSHPAHQY